jgi:hypothetical protein
MNPENQEFEQLRRLLALKRHEQPPPGYFPDFSAEIIARIKAGDMGEPEPLIERLLRDAPWLGRLLSMLEAKPAFAGAFGAAVSALLISGILYSEGAESPSLLPDLAVGTTLTLDGSTTLAMNDSSSLQPMPSGSSTNPVVPPTGSLFDQIQFPPGQPASFQMPGN